MKATLSSVVIYKMYLLILSKRSIILFEKVKPQAIHVFLFFSILPSCKLCHTVPHKTIDSAVITLPATVYIDQEFAKITRRCRILRQVVEGIWYAARELNLRVVNNSVSMQLAGGLLASKDMN